MIAKTSLTSGLLLDDTVFVPTDLALLDFAEAGDAGAADLPASDDVPAEAAADDTPVQSLIAGTAEPTGTANLRIAALSAAKSEGNSGLTDFTFKVFRDGDLTMASTARWAVTGYGANAASAADFQGGLLPSGTVSFAPGETSKVVTVKVAGDTVAETNEAFAVRLSAPSTGTVLSSATAAGTIVDDDTFTVGFAPVQGQTSPPGYITLPEHTTFVEGNSGTTHATFVVNRAGALASAVSVNWKVGEPFNTGLDGLDFGGLDLPFGTISFAAGETQKILTLDIAGDTKHESDEFFTVALSGASPGGILTTNLARGIIANDDFAASPAPHAMIGLDTIRAGLDAPSPSFLSNDGGTDGDARKAGDHPMDLFDNLACVAMGSDGMLAGFALKDEGFSALFVAADTGIGGGMDWLSGAETKAVLALRDGFA